MKRQSGVLLPVFSLPSGYGIGDLGKCAYTFVNDLKEAGQSYWQVLPIGPTGYGDSPYQSFSSFAGNPYFISPEKLIEQNLLTKDECDSFDFGSNPLRIDYPKLFAYRQKLLHKAFERFKEKHSKDFEAFCDKEKSWLCDYSLFMSLKEAYGGKPLAEWDKDIRLRKKDALDKYKASLSERISFHKFLQFCFYNQWDSLKAYANSKGVQIIGDLPIYVSPDSVDLWTSKELFDVDENLIPRNVAGCPPDSFSESGQLWGNPLYDWKENKRSDYKWWKKRIEKSLELFDALRIDHFRGFDEYYSIPYGSKNAANGEWKKGPGKDLFHKLMPIMKKRLIIAEDLGFITPSVKKLVRECGFLGMKVLQFAFDSRDSSDFCDHIPHKYQKNCVCYTATHDNPPTTAWLSEITEEERQTLRRYLCDYFTPPENLSVVLAGLAMRSKATLCIIPMQDWICSKDRINTPSTCAGNWQTRMPKGFFSESLKEKMAELTKLCGRIK